jgi:hypothetical protein
MWIGSNEHNGGLTDVLPSLNLSDLTAGVKCLLAELGVNPCFATAGQPTRLDPPVKAGWVRRGNQCLHRTLRDRRRYQEPIVSPDWYRRLQALMVLGLPATVASGELATQRLWGGLEHAKRELDIRTVYSDGVQWWKCPCEEGQFRQDGLENS